MNPFVYLITFKRGPFTAGVVCVCETRVLAEDQARRLRKTTAGNTYEIWPAQFCRRRPMTITTGQRRPRQPHRRSKR